MKITLKDVAELAGVSRSAVSRTFTEGASVSDKTRQKVEQAAHQLGYHPNALASGLSTGRTKLIGLISNNFHNPIFLEVFDRFTRGLQEYGFRPLIVNLTDETDPAQSIRLLRQYSVDGVVVASSTLPPSFVQAFHDAGLPVVHAFGRVVSDPDFHVIGIDNVDCGRLAARALVERGYRRIGFLGGPRFATSTQDRLVGFLEVAASLSEVSATQSFAEAYSFDAGRAEMLRLIRQETCLAEAYFCGDDILSIGAMSALESEGVAVPGEVGIIGLNDMEMARWHNIDLTTIHQPIGEIIMTTVELIVEILSTETCPPSVRLFPCPLVERGTLRPSQAISRSA
ncbi:MAG: LacI family DNA-binding transcriptional regulator [Pseudomonadota bacterium]